MTSSLPPLAQALSGAVGSATANSLSYPLDLVATKLQTTTHRRLQGFRGVLRLLRHVTRTEGLAGLYDGLGPDTASTLISNFLYFYFYALLHALAARRKAGSRDSLIQSVRAAVTNSTRPTLLSVPTELAVGFVAGVASRAVSTPLSLVTVRMQTDNDEGDSDSEDEVTAATEDTRPQNRSPSFVNTVQRICAEDGLAGFWAGFQPTLPLCLTPALTLLLFQFLSRLRVAPSAKTRTSSSGAFLSGATANALATAIVYPLLLAKVRVQASRAQGGRRTLSTADVWAKAIKAEGWAGLYQGLPAQLLKGFVNQGVTMLVKQRIERAAVGLYSKKR
ncbi:mitochondrial carrier domain-containing protein [Lenzites betulinus]|nr:mitochondrial carrier domain-containing protein [Lenzites betulinus]